eukprot:scaffold2841_cov31-Attheya_sp.AAC.1
MMLDLPRLGLYLTDMQLTSHTYSSKGRGRRLNSRVLIIAHSRTIAIHVANTVSVQKNGGHANGVPIVAVHGVEKCNAMGDRCA